MFVTIRDILSAVFSFVGDVFRTFFGKTVESDIEFDLLIVALLLILLTLLMISASWASSIASARRHSAKLHFVLGGLCPFLYPFLIMFAMDVKGAKERERKIQMEREALEAVEKRRRELGGDEDAYANSAADLEENVPEVVYNQEYFRSIALDADGNQTGPWLIRYADQEVMALRIVEPLAQGVAIEIQGSGDKQQTMRIPYNKIVACEPG